MDDDEFKEDDDDIHKIGVQNKNFHFVNKKTYEFKIDYEFEKHFDYAGRMYARECFESSRSLRAYYELC